MSSGAKVNSQAVADMITALVTMQNKMMAMENNLELGMTTAGAQWKDDQFKKIAGDAENDARASVGAFEKGGRRHFAPGKNQKSHRRLQ